MASTWSLVADRPLRVDRYELESLQATLPGGFERWTTVIHLHGAGHEGVGEDVTYEPRDHEVMLAAGPALPLAGEWTLASFSAHLAGLDLFPAPPEMDVFRAYRAWAFESAALDLALRQAGEPLHAALGRESGPVTFVVSMRLPGEPPAAEAVRGWLGHQPGLRFKLDAVSTWTEDLVRELAATGAVESIDLKGQYAGTIVDQPPDPVLYRRVVHLLPGVLIEDPRLTDETRAILAGHEHRITWDAPIHSLADVDALPFPPRTLNVKASRFGRLEALLDFYDACEERGISCYGGGQSELGPGRGQIQYLASLFHPGAPNDTAPSAYNLTGPAPGLPSSPLPPAPSATGFRWGER
jgi:hypothetical protein